jgi:hypothetical protein
MKDVNWPLRKAYSASLNGLTVDAVSVPVYYMEAPSNYTGQAYILLVSPSNVDASTFNSSDTNTSMQVQIHTWSDYGNAGKLASDIAGAVFAAIYPNPQAVLDLSADDLQMVSTKLQNDLDGRNVRFGQREYVQRIITFSHNIFHK